jgi:DNA polymerase-3 subunit gamma/tau
VRKLLGIFGMDALGDVAVALEKQDATRMLEIVLELERSGQSLQHFCRELARYFRNLLVARVTGGKTHLIAASPAEIERYVATAQKFSELDLTRYLKLTLDLFGELQHSLQPRLHMELGLIRMVQAGKLVAIEEVLASLPAAKPMALSAAATAPRERANLRVSAPPVVEKKPEPAVVAPSAVAAVADDSPLKQRLVACLLEQNKKFSADAVQHARVEEVPTGLRFTAPREFVRPLQSRDIAAALTAVMGRMVKVEVVRDDSVSEVKAAAPKPPEDDEATRERALNNPQVQRYREIFPDAVLRGVRDLSNQE